MRSFKPREMGFVLEGQTCAGETVALAVGWGQGLGAVEEELGEGRCLPHLGLGRVVTLGQKD